MVKVTLSGAKEAKARFSSSKGKKVLSASLKRLVEFCENKIGLNAYYIVYGYKPKTANYVRTGRLLGGRGNGLSGGKPATTQLNDLAYQVEANPRLKGASFNYASYVDRGKGWMRKVGPRPFWRVSIRQTQQEAPRILSQETNNQFN